MGGRAQRTWMAVAIALLVAGNTLGCATRAPQRPATTEGVASWYGPGFHGRATASGERYDQDGLTAAHRTWPLGTSVRVTHLDSGRSIVVRINDRGPFVDGREIDLSRESARRLGMLRAGTARVKLEPLPNGNKPLGTMQVAVQVGSFTAPGHAENLRRQVESLRGLGRTPNRPGPRDVYVAEARNPDRTLYRVRVGPCANREEATALASSLRRAGHETLIVEEVISTP